MTNENELVQIRDFKGQYPKQLWALFFSEMWERFCFYGMRGMLSFFMVYQLGMQKEAANLQYGATQAWVYAFTFIGGLFADKILRILKIALTINLKPFIFLNHFFFLNQLFKKLRSKKIKLKYK